MPYADLDAMFVRNAVCPPGKRKETYYDNTVTGFILEVRSTGSMTYGLRYTDTHSKLKQYTIGKTKDLPFEKAKQTAIKLRARVVLGESPIEERKTLRIIPSLAEFACDRYMPFVKGYKKSWDSDDSYLRNHILPKWGNCHLDQVTQQSVIEFHHGMRPAYAAGTANRMIILLRYMYNLGRKWKIPGAENNPTAGVQLLEDNGARERYLTREEAQRLVGSVKGSDNTQLQFIVPLLLLLGCRKRELLDSKWQDFDIERRSWRIPLTKSGKARHMPLSAAVLQILETTPRFADCPYVVPNPKTLKPYVSIYYAWHTAPVGRSNSPTCGHLKFLHPMTA